MKNTKYFKKYWQTRKMDWSKNFDPDHPHRQRIIEAISMFRFRSILEVGCGVGPNLYKIKQVFSHADVGGLDWNADAIEEAKRKLPRASILQVGEANDIYISDKGSDLLLSDMCYIYLDKKNFRKAIDEAKRVARVGVIFCEFHSANWFKRLYLKMISGYNAYDYRKELRRVGFNDIKIYKLTDEDWPSNTPRFPRINPQKVFGSIITARA